MGGALERPAFFSPAERPQALETSALKGKRSPAFSWPSCSIRYRLKPISKQTFVIIGASSGKGLATAAVRRGANVVIAARNESAQLNARR
jgi:hypothetical protein